MIASNFQLSQTNFLLRLKSLSQRGVGWERERERQTDRPTDKDRERKRDRDRERQRQRKREREKIMYSCYFSQF